MWSHFGRYMVFEVAADLHQVDGEVFIAICHTYQAVYQVVAECARSSAPLFAFDTVLVGLAGKNLDLIGVLFGQIGSCDLGTANGATGKFTGAAGIGHNKYFGHILC